MALIEGSGVAVWLRFTDPSNRQPFAPAQPIIVTFVPPTGPPREVIATRRQPSVYLAQVVGDVAGWWTYRAVSSDAAPGVVEGRFQVAESMI